MLQVIQQRCNINFWDLDAHLVFMTRREKSKKGELYNSFRLELQY